MRNVVMSFLLDILWCLRDNLEFRMKLDGPVLQSFTVLCQDV